MGSDASAFDVAVIGGGPAGLAAAIAAASRGARTLLVEAKEKLGGNATGAFVHTICGLYDLADDGPPRLIHPGFASAFAESLRERGGAAAPERAGKVWVLPTRPPEMEHLAREWCARQAQLELRTGCRLERALLAENGDRPHELVLAERAADRRRLRAQIVIDASGDGVLGALGSAASERAPLAQRQLPSYIVRLGGVPAADREGFGRLRLTAAVAGASRKGALPEACASVLLRPVPGSEDAYLTLNLPRDAVADRPHAEIETQCRARVSAIVEHLRGQREGYDQCGVVTWPDHLGVREGARLLGRCVLDEQALLSGQRRENEVALSTWPIELWHDHRRATLRHVSGPAGIPADALISASHPRLGMAGRCMSATHTALGALRVIGTAMATGEAIGLAAAIAAERGAELHTIGAGEIRAAREAGFARGFRPGVG